MATKTKRKLQDTQEPQPQECRLMTRREIFESRIRMFDDLMYSMSPKTIDFCDSILGQYIEHGITPKQADAFIGVIDRHKRIQESKSIELMCPTLEMQGMIGHYMQLRNEISALKDKLNELSVKKESNEPTNQHPDRPSAGA